MKFLTVRDWQKHFENNRTRELKNLDWVPIPNKHDGDGFSELMDHPNGTAHYGAWMLITQVASKCDVRGTLLRDGARPYDATSLARVTRGNRAVFEEALPRLVAIGWLEEVELDDEELAEMSQDDAEISQDVAPRVRARALKRREGNERTKGREGKGSERNESAAGDSEHPVQVASSEIRFFKGDQNGTQNGTHEPKAVALSELVRVAAAEEPDALEDLCFSVLGKDEMARYGARWRKRGSTEPDKLRRVLVEMRANEREGGRIVKRGAYAEDL